MAAQQNPPPYILTLQERNLTVQALVAQGYTDVRLPSGQLINLAAQELFFNQTGVVYPGVVQQLDFARVRITTGLFIWVIAAIGGGTCELRIGFPTLTSGHPELAEGLPVYGAGQIFLVNGCLSTLDNVSGHYLPFGIRASFVEGVFQKIGLSASGLYQELTFP